MENIEETIFQPYMASNPIAAASRLKYLLKNKGTTDKKALQSDPQIQQCLFLLVSLVGDEYTDMFAWFSELSETRTKPIEQ